MDTDVYTSLAVGCALIFIQIPDYNLYYLQIHVQSHRVLTLQPLLQLVVELNTLYTMLVPSHLYGSSHYMGKFYQLSE